MVLLICIYHLIQIVYGYDINLLYLAVMKDKNFSISKPIYFKDNIYKCEPKAFSFF